MSSDSPPVPATTPSAAAGHTPDPIERADSEQRLRLLIEQSPTSIHVVNASGHTVLVNPAFERLWGIGMKELEGYVLWDDPQLETNGLWPYVDRARRGEVVRVPPFRHDPQVSVGQGKARVIDTTVYPVKDGAGAVRELVILHTDITEQVAAEEAVRDSGRRLVEALELTPLPVLELDVAGRVTFANAAVSRALELEQARIIGRRMDELPIEVRALDGSSLTIEQRPVGLALAGKVVTALELLVTTPSGARHIFEVHAAPRRDAEGAIVGVIAAFDDVTSHHAAAAERERLLAAERRAREEADRKRRQADFLAEASRLLSDTLEHEATLRQLASAMVPALADWCVVDLLQTPRSPTRSAASGTSPADWPPVVERIAVAHVDPARVAWAQELERRWPTDWSAARGMARVIREGVTEFVPVLTEAHFSDTAADPERMVLVRALGMSSYLCVPMIARGQVVGAIGLARTVPGQHYDADDLALAEDLARRAAVAVDNARLYREAVEANRAKRDFLAVMSHELRTPLNAILGYAGLLEGEVAGPVTDPQREFLRRGSDAARRLLTLVDDLLTFAKVEAGRVTMHPSAVSVSTLVADVVPLVAPQAALRGVVLDVGGGPGAELVVLADRERAAQVLLNLLANAVKFTPAGGRVQLSANAPQPGAVHVAVRDTGAGIAAEDLDRVFQPFVQLDAGPTRAAGGTGLGLAIARDLARAMDGDVLAASVCEGATRGSTFTLVLPRA